MKVLYTSQSIRNAIVELMSPGNARRVAIVAFVGADARAYIPRPRGVEIVCWPKAGGTNPLELRRLKKLGAKIRFCDGLHMKVYWASGRGCVVTSANLSMNALGAGGLKEVGVFLPAGAFDVDRLLAALSTRPFNKSDLNKLELAHREAVKHHLLKGRKSDQAAFQEWLTLPARAEWKLVGVEADGEYCHEAKDVVRRDYNRKSPEDAITCRRDGLGKGEWVLHFHEQATDMCLMSWMYVDFVARIGPKENLFSKDFPCQAIQVWSLRQYPPPPFALTKAFRNAFRTAVRRYGVKRLRRFRWTRPPVRLLDLIAREMRK